MRKYLLRGETLWDVKDTCLGSWVWRKILKFRTLAKQFLRMNIKNGQTVKFWTDVWLPARRLIDLAGEIGTQKLGIPRNARICDVLDGEVWNLRASRDQHIQQLVQVIRQFPLSLTVNVPDGVMWRNGPDDYGDSSSLLVLGNRSNRVEMKFSGARLSGSPKGYLVSLSSLG